MFKEIKKWQIKTPNGWSDFLGIQKLKKSQLYEIKFDDNSIVTATKDHCFFISNIKKLVSELREGDSIDGTSKGKKIISITKFKEEEVYDIVESQDDNKFIVNKNIITKNCDEFAFVPQNIAEPFWRSNFPTLSNGGAAILVSTPNGAAGKFYEIYKEADAKQSPFVPFKVNWHEFPGRDEKWKEDMIASIGKVAFAQEYNCSFTGSSVTLIDGDILSRLSGDEPPHIPAPHYMIWKKFVPGRVYAFGIDTAHGGGNDYSVINIYDITTYPIDGKYEQVAMYRRNDINIFAFEKETLELTKKWGQPIVICESNEMGLGNVLCEQLYMEDGYERMYYDMETGKGGIQANVKTKKLATTYFKDDVEKGKCKIHSKIQLSEMGIFEEQESSPGTFKARKGRGFNDDTVTSSYWMSYLLKSKWFEDMTDEIYKDPISRQTAIPKDGEKIDEEQLETFNSIFTSDLDGAGDDWEKELWK